MPKELEILILGSGTSHGIPMIGCDCHVCRSDDPRDKRNRASGAVRVRGDAADDDRVILIDMSPELRLSAVAYRLDRVDAVLLTHAHADHLMGLDDIRRYNNISGGTIPIYSSREALDKVQTCFGYAVGPYVHPHRPSVSLVELAATTEICGAAVKPVPLTHGLRQVLGFRIGGFAWCTDVSAIPEASAALLEGLDLLVLGALRYMPHPEHFNLDQALAAVEQLKPRRTVLTHIAHEILHARTSAQLPDEVELAYDGMRIIVYL